MPAAARIRRSLVTLAAVTGLMALPAAAQADITQVFDPPIPCAVDSTDQVRECSGKVPTFDGVPIDVNVAFPPEPATGPDGDFPLVMVFHGYGGSKIGFSGLRRWTDRGYAAFTMTDRGFHQSCGAQVVAAELPPGICAQKGYVRLIDNRYEVRDAQEFAAQLADQGLILPRKIGSIGGSYGGGMSMALAALRNRKALQDGTLVPWLSPDGKPMEIAAAAPEIPWTDLAYSLAPNGSTLDYVAENPYGERIGILKQSFVAGLYALGQIGGQAYYSPPAPPGAPGGTAPDPDADLTTWFAQANQGEPYEQNPVVQHMVDELTTNHSSYYIPDSVAPAPLLISNGWTDDLFPADEAIRFYNRTRAHHPGSPISLFFLDYGHQRGQGKAADIALLRERQELWFDHYIRGEGATPFQGVTTLTQTCPKTAPSGGPFSAPSWGELAPGEVRFTAQGSKVIAPELPDNQTNQAFDPITGPGACATTPAADQPGTATYRLDPAPAGGYTLLGSPTITAKIAAPSPTSQIAARLLDVAPDGTQTLVARGLYRPGINQTSGGREVFQLHPNGWLFAPGHIAKLELRPNDKPYSRPSNGQGPVTITDLQLRLPVRERPSGEGPVVVPDPKPVPDDDDLAPGFKRSRVSLGAGRVRASGGVLDVPVRCRGPHGRCTAAIWVRGFWRGKKGKRHTGRLAHRPVFYVPQNSRKVLHLRLTKRGRYLFANRRTVRTKILLRSEAGTVVRGRTALRRRAAR